MARQRARRPTWKGFLTLNLVSVPVQVFTAREREASEVDLDWLHKECHSRIRYTKTCPIHGEVSKDEIVTGYQFRKGQYVEIKPEELQKARGQRDKSIAIDVFIEPDAQDPIYFEKTYYLVPDGSHAQKAYGLLHRGTVKQLARLRKRNELPLVMKRELDGSVSRDGKRNVGTAKKMRALSAHRRRAFKETKKHTNHDISEEEEDLFQP